MHDPWAALRHADYRRLLASVLAVTLAVQVQDLVVAWQIYVVTRDPLALGLVGLAEALPNIATSLVGGHVADRMDRRRLAIIATVVLVGCALTLAVLAGGAASLAGWRIGGVYAVVAVSGVARAFLQPARTALGAAMVSRELRPNAVAWRSTTWQLGAVVGPALGGLLNAAVGYQGAYLIAAALVALGLAWLAAVRFRAVPDRRPGESVLTSLAEGIRYLRRQQILLGAMTLDLFSVLFGGAVALLPIFVADILHTGVWGLGVLRAAPAVGALAMSLFLAWRTPLRRAGRDLLLAVAAFGALTIGFGLARTLWLSFVCLAASGAADMISVVIRSTLLQLMVPDRLMGRVTSVNAIFIGSSNEIGSFESGLTARLMGAVPAVLMGGGITLGVVGATAILAPDLRNVGRLADLPEVTDEGPVVNRPERSERSEG